MTVDSIFPVGKRAGQFGARSQGVVQLMEGNKGCDDKGCGGDGNCKSDNTMAMMAMMVVKRWQ